MCTAHQGEEHKYLQMSLVSVSLSVSLLNGDGFQGTMEGTQEEASGWLAWLTLPVGAMQSCFPWNSSLQGSGVKCRRGGWLWKQLEGPSWVLWATSCITEAGFQGAGAGKACPALSSSQFFVVLNTQLWCSSIVERGGASVVCISRNGDKILGFPSSPAS